MPVIQAKLIERVLSENEPADPFRVARCVAGARGSAAMLGQGREEGAEARVGPVALHVAHPPGSADSDRQRRVPGCLDGGRSVTATSQQMRRIPGKSFGVSRPTTTVRFASPRRLSGMRGVITGKDVLRHSVTICRLWGPRCYLRCLPPRPRNRPPRLKAILVAHGRAILRAFGGDVDGAPGIRTRNPARRAPGTGPPPSRSPRAVPAELPAARRGQLRAAAPSLRYARRHHGQGRSQALGDHLQALGSALLPPLPPRRPELPAEHVPRDGGLCLTGVAGDDQPLNFARPLRAPGYLEDYARLM